VISSYLGCINHSLLSIDYLKRNNFKIKALVFNGEFELEVKQAIIANVTNTLIIDIPSLKDLSKQSVFQISSKIKPQISL
jgi:dethiobiotin synthetase